eukprot:scaffold24110_cov19-Tisochrysis_lutea.AAC.1
MCLRGCHLACTPKQEARAEQAEAEAQRANAMAFRLTRELEKMRGITSGPKQPGLQESDSDSAFGLAGACSIRVRGALGMHSDRVQVTACLDWRVRAE